ncbi:MAG: ABC-2 transporter permease, partial [Lachnospiraceae bacterium]|nr:ABC-2 transporter permease [Lachnospiraceae bacterium]
MGGLLYKDFVAIRGKKLIMITGIALVLFTILRVIFPGSREIPGVMAKNDDGEVLNMIDAFLWYGEFCVLMIGYGQVSASWYRTSELDEKNRVRNYFSSLPLRKQTYVAEKYIFTAITAYVWFSVYMIWHIVF